MICSDCEQFPVIHKVIRTRPISPLPLAGEGEGAVCAHHPHLYPLPPTEGEGANGIELPSFK